MGFCSCLQRNKNEEKELQGNGTKPGNHDTEVNKTAQTQELTTTIVQNGIDMPGVHKKTPTVSSKVQGTVVPVHASVNVDYVASQANLSAPVQHNSDVQLTSAQYKVQYNLRAPESSGTNGTNTIPIKTVVPVDTPVGNSRSTSGYRLNPEPVVTINSLLQETESAPVHKPHAQLSNNSKYSAEINVGNKSNVTPVVSINKSQILEPLVTIRGTLDRPGKPLKQTYPLDRYDFSNDVSKDINSNDVGIIPMFEDAKHEPFVPSSEPLEVQVDSSMADQAEISYSPSLSSASSVQITPNPPQTLRKTSIPAKRLEPDGSSHSGSMSSKAPFEERSRTILGNGLYHSTMPKNRPLGSPVVTDKGNFVSAKTHVSFPSSTANLLQSTHTLADETIYHTTMPRDATIYESRQSLFNGNKPLANGRGASDFILQPLYSQPVDTIPTYAHASTPPFEVIMSTDDIYATVVPRDMRQLSNPQTTYVLTPPR